MSGELIINNSYEEGLKIEKLVERLGLTAQEGAGEKVA